MSAPQVKGLNCPNCGAPLEMRAMQHTLSVVCGSCLSILDAKDPNLRILQQFQARVRIQPLIPLGTRGKVGGGVFEAVGFQVRTIVVDDESYSWSEYLLFNPYKGFRYLSEYQGHWNDIVTLRALPEVSGAGRPVAKYHGETYKHFQNATASTTYVLGEFPWQVHVGDKVTVVDFVSPPRLLSSEATEAETVWSLGEYLTGAAVWEAFKLPGKPPRPSGVFENQPSPYKSGSKQAWIICLLLLAALFLASQVALTLSANERVFAGSYSYAPGAGSEAAFVTDTFQLKGRPSTVELAVRTDLANNWAYFNFALINAQTGETFEFGREVSNYSGVDSDGSWSEGGPNDRATIPTVPAGEYYLRVDPEMESGAAPVHYSLELRRDVPYMAWFWIAALLALIPPFFSGRRAASFERRRWSESDYA